MSICENLSRVLKRYKEEHHLTFVQLAALLDLPVSSVQKYHNGSGNPRADTLELISKKLGIPLTELVAGPLPEQKQAESATRAAERFAGLPSDIQDGILQIFDGYAALLSK